MPIKTDEAIEAGTAGMTVDEWRAFKAGKPKPGAIPYGQATLGGSSPLTEAEKKAESDRKSAALRKFGRM